MSALAAVAAPYPAEQKSILALEGVAHAFGGLKVLTDVSLTVPGGSIVGLIGPNGSGKTTLFNIASGFLRPLGGRVVYDGADVTARTVPERSRIGLVRTFQTPKVFERMSVVENLMVGAYASTQAGMLAAMLRTPGARRDLDTMRDEAIRACDRFGLARVAERPAGSLPAGLRRNIELARAYVAKPRLLLLDEPSSGLNTAEIASLKDWIRVLNGEGMSVLLVSHDMGLMEVCHTVHALTLGEIVASGTLDAIRSHPRVREAYLGA
jgi:ABC-type branched-subunit amino acid transport system ATPase component